MVTHWNVRGARRRAPVFDDLLGEHESDICMLCETHSQGVSYDTRGFKWVSGPEHRPTTSRPRAGIGALVRNNLARSTVAIQFPDLPLQHSMWLRVSCENDRSLVIGEAYAPGRDHPAARAAMYAELSAAISRLRKTGPLLLLGDFNARAQANGDDRLDSEGTELLDFAASHYLDVINLSPGICSGEFTFTELRADELVRTTIDYALVPSEYAHMVRSMAIDPEQYTSDHHPLHVTMCLDAPLLHVRDAAAVRRVWRVRGVQPATMTRFGKVNDATCAAWLGASDAMNAFAERMDLSSAVRTEMELESLNLAISLSAEATIGSKRTGGVQVEQSWWNEECTRARLARAAACRNGRPSSVLAAHRAFRRAVCRAKRADHRRRGDELEFADFDGDPRAFWYKVAQMCPSLSMSLPPVRLEDGSLTTSVPSALRRWRDYFARLHAKDTTTTAFDSAFERHVLDELKKLEITCGPFKDFCVDKKITEAEVGVAFARVHNGTSPGVDGLVPELFRHADRSAVAAVTRLFQHVYEREYWPQQWRVGLVVPIHKDGDRSYASNYRGISLLPVMSKIFEHVLLDRLMKWAEAAGVLADEQGGFRPDRGTLDQVFILHEIVADRKERRLPTALAFIDVRKAYDRTWRAGLWLSTNDIGCEGKPLRVLREMFDHGVRRVAAYGCESEPFALECGVPQGSVLSPFLYCVFINGLANELKRDPRFGVDVCGERVPLLLYADDIVLLATPETLQAMLDVCSAYAKRWWFEFNQEKSNVVLVVEPRLLEPLAGAVWTLGERRITVEAQYRYLGLLFNGKSKVRRFAAAVDELISRANKTAGRILWQCDYGRSIHARGALRLWRTQVQPILDYGAGLWGIGVSQQQARRLESVFSRFARGLLGTSTGTAAAFLRAEFGVQSQQVRREEFALRWWYHVEKEVDAGRLLSKLFLQRKARFYGGGGHRRGGWFKDFDVVRRRYPSLEDYLSGHTVPKDKDDWLAIVGKAVKQRDDVLWLEEAQGKSSMKPYLSFKQAPQLESYIGHQHHAAATTLAKLRAGSLELGPVQMRRAQLPAALGVCCLCGTGVQESVRHFVLVCPALAAQRDKLVATVCERLRGWADEQAHVVRDHFNNRSTDAIQLALGCIPKSCVAGLNHKAVKGVSSVLRSTSLNYVHACWRRRSALLSRGSALA